jgi:hypothetical protein
VTEPGDDVPIVEVNREQFAERQKVNREDVAEDPQMSQRCCSPPTLL